MRYSVYYDLIVWSICFSPAAKSKQYNELDRTSNFKLCNFAIAVVVSSRIGKNTDYNASAGGFKSQMP